MKNKTTPGSRGLRPSDFNSSKLRIRVMTIKINSLYRSDMNQEEIYEATRKWWVAKKDRAEKVEYVLCVNNGIVRGVFKPINWLKMEGSNRIGFNGEIASDFIIERYLHKSIEDYIVKGNANPIQYFFINKVNSKLTEIYESNENINEKEIEIIEKSILIKINSSFYEGMSRDEIYKATKGNWKLSLEKSQKVEYVFSIVNGAILEVFKVLNWYKVEDSDRTDFKEKSRYDYAT